MLINYIQVIKWPVAVAIIAIVAIALLRKSISSFIDRIKNFRIPKVEVSTDGSTIQQSVKEGAPKKEINKDIEKLLRIFDSPLVQIYEESIMADIKTRNINDPIEREKILIHHLAVMQMLYNFELIYSTIWGSQITILNHLNQLPLGALKTEIQNYYNAVSKEYPAVYQNYSYDNYLGYLEKVGLIKVNNNILIITPFGREFLIYLTQQSKPQKIY